MAYKKSGQYFVEVKWRRKRRCLLIWNTKNLIKKTIFSNYLISTRRGNYLIRISCLSTAHPELNQVEIVLSRMTQAVAQQNLKFQFSDLGRRIEEDVKRFTPETFIKYVDHVFEEEERMQVCWTHIWRTARRTQRDEDFESKTSGDRISERKWKKKHRWI